MTLEIIILNLDDNVATAVRRLETGEFVSSDGDKSVTLSQDVPAGHKLALCDIATGDKIIKYGEVVGRATADIMSGEHVHVHNVEGLRGRGDKQ